MNAFFSLTFRVPACVWETQTKASSELLKCQPITWIDTRQGTLMISGIPRFLSSPWVTLEIRLYTGGSKCSLQLAAPRVLHLNSYLRQDLCLNLLFAAWCGKDCDSWACLGGFSVWTVRTCDSQVFFLPSLVNGPQGPRKELLGVFLCVVNANLFSLTLSSKEQRDFELHLSGKIIFFGPCFKTGFWLILHFSQSPQLSGSPLDFLHNLENNWLLLIRENMSKAQRSYCSQPAAHCCFHCPLINF